MEVFKGDPAKEGRQVAIRERNMSIKVKKLIGGKV